MSSRQFKEGFIEECYRSGMDERQTAALLNVYMAKEAGWGKTALQIGGGLLGAAGLSYGAMKAFGGGGDSSKPTQAGPDWANMNATEYAKQRRNLQKEQQHLMSNPNAAAKREFNRKTKEYNENLIKARANYDKNQAPEANSEYNTAVRLGDEAQSKADFRNKMMNMGGGVTRFIGNLFGVDDKVKELNADASRYRAQATSALGNKSTPKSNPFAGVKAF